MKQHVTSKWASLALATGLLLFLSACGPQPRQMPVASTSPSTSATTKAPSDELAKDEATKERPVLLASKAIGEGVQVKVYRVGAGTVVPQQLASNPALVKAGVKVGSKVAVIRYSLANTSAKAVPTVTFAYNGVFVAGGGKPAAADNGYASATARLGYTPTPVGQFTDKQGKAGSWLLAPGKSANWYTDWVLESKGVLAQNFFLGQKTTGNVRIDLLK